MSAADGTERKLVTAHAGRRSAPSAQGVKRAWSSTPDPESSSPPNEPASDEDDDYHPDDSEEDVEDEDDPADPDAEGADEDGSDADEPLFKSQDSEGDERPRAETAPDDGVELADEVRDSKSKALPAAEARKLMTAAAANPKKSKAKRKHEGKTAAAAAKPARVAKKPKPADLDCCICGATQASDNDLTTDFDLGYTRGFCAPCFYEITKQKRCSECLRPTLWAGNIGLTCRCTKHGAYSILCKICSYDDSVEVNVSESGVRIIPFYCDQCTTDEFATNEPIVYAIEVPEKKEKKKKGVTFASKPDVAPVTEAGGADDDAAKSTIPAAALIAMNSACRFFVDFETCATTQPTGTTIYCSSCELYQCENCMQKCDTCSLEWCEVCVNMCPHKAPSNYGPVVYGTAAALRGALSSAAATTAAAVTAPKTATAAAVPASSHMDNKHKPTPTGDAVASLVAAVEMSFCANKKCDELSSDVCKACAKFVCASAACNLTCTSCNETVCVNCIVHCDTPGCGNTRCVLCTAEDRAQPAQVDFYCYECATRPEP